MSQSHRPSDFLTFLTSNLPLSTYFIITVEFFCHMIFGFISDFDILI